MRMKTKSDLLTGQKEEKLRKRRYFPSFVSTSFLASVVFEILFSKILKLSKKYIMLLKASKQIVRLI